MEATRKLKAVFESFFDYKVWGIKNQKCTKNVQQFWRFGSFGGHQRPFKITRGCLFESLMLDCEVSKDEE